MASIEKQQKQYKFFNLNTLIAGIPKEKLPVPNYYNRMTLFMRGLEDQATPEMITFMEKLVDSAYKGFRAELAEAKKRAKERAKSLK